MKIELLSAFAVAIMMAACSNQESFDSNLNQPVQQTSNIRSYEEAMQIAQTSIEMVDGQAKTRSTTQRKIDLNKTKVYEFNATTRSGGYKIDTLMYVFNFANNEGFAVVSASRQTDGLIAVVESGNYDPTVPTGNPGFDTFMRMAEACIVCEENATVVNEENKARTRGEGQMYQPLYDTIYYKKIDPRITVKWGQGYQMGQYCPNHLCGCSITAAAQIMSYFKYPSSITLTYTGRDVNSTNLDWTDMCGHIYSDDSYNVDEADKQMGRLARQLGELAESDYHSEPNNNYTYTINQNIRSAIQYLGYTVGTITDYDYMITDYAYDFDAGYTLANRLSEGKLIFMVGSNSGNNNHAWVIDGCYYVKCKYYLMVSDDGGVTWYVDHELATYRTCHNHINWGWYGAQNGYFNSWVFNAYNSYQLDPSLYTLNPNQNVNYYNNIKYFTVYHQ